MKKISRLAYKLDILSNWRIDPVFSVVQLEPALTPAKELFARLFLSNASFVLVEGDTSNKLKSIEIERLLNKY